MNIETIKNHFTLVKMAFSKKTKDNKSWQGCGGVWTLHTDENVK